MEIFREENLKKIFQGVVFLILLIPLVYLKNIIWPFIAGKMIPFQILVFFLLLIWFFLLLLDFKKYRPPLNLLTIALTIFILAIFLSTIFSLNFYRSFWGNGERMEGFLDLLFFYLFALALMSVLKEKEVWKKLLIFSLIVSLFSALYPLFQKWGWLSQPQRQLSDRPGGSFGNPTFISGYLLIHLFLGLWLILDNYQKKKKLLSLENLFFFFILAVNFGVLVWLATRGSFFGLFLALLFSLFLLIGFFPKKIKIISLILLILVIFSGVGLFLFREKLQNFSLFSKIPILERLTTTLTWKDSSARSRFASWSWSLDWFKKRPILGVGQDVFYLLYDKNYNPNNFNLNSERFDRSHNKFIDLLVMNGIVGLLAYLFLLGVLFFFLIKKLKKAETPALKFSFLVLIALLIAYLGHLSFVFDTPTSYLIFFFLLGFFSFLFFNEPLERKTFEKKLISPWQISVTLIFLLIWAFLFYQIIYLPLKASHWAFQAANSLVIEEAFEKFQSAIDLNTYFNSDIRKIWGDYFSTYLVYLQISQKTEDKEKLKELASWFEKEMKRGWEREELFDFPLRRGFIYSQLSQLAFFSDAEREEFDQKAEEIFEEIVRSYPQRTDLYIIYPEGLVLRQDFSKAERWAKMIIEKTPSYPRAQWLWAVISLTKEDRLEEAFRYLKSAIEKGHRWETQQKAGLLLAVAPYLKNPHLLIVLLEDQLSYWKTHPSIQTSLEEALRQEKIKSYLQLLIFFYTQYNLPEYQKLVSYLEEFLKYAPERADYWAKLAVAYAKLKKKEPAIFSARKAMELDPQNYQKEGEEFIHLVENEQWELIR